MQTKLEQVARAIYEADDPWSSAFPWPDLKEGRPRADEYRRVARAAIEAMPVPTPGMLIAAGTMEGYSEAESCSLGGPDADHIAWWNAMIDAALKEGEGTSTP